MLFWDITSWGLLWLLLSVVWGLPILLVGWSIYACDTLKPVGRRMFLLRATLWMSALVILLCAMEVAYCTPPEPTFIDDTAPVEDIGWWDVALYFASLAAFAMVLRSTSQWLKATGRSSQWLWLLLLPYLQLIVLLYLAAARRPRPSQERERPHG